MDLNPGVPVVAYRGSLALGRWLRDYEQPWFLEVDIFASDLTELHLNPHTRRCLEEGLDAFRRGLYLACANLMGAVSEGDWFALGEKLRGSSTSMDRALDHGRVVEVQRRVAQDVRDRHLDNSFHEVEAQAALLRRLRNYGTHPGAGAEEDLQRYFSEATCDRDGKPEPPGRKPRM